MAVRANRKSKSKRVLVAGSVHPYYRQAAIDIVDNQQIELVEIPVDSATLSLDMSKLSDYEGQDFAALIVAQPNFFGTLEEVDQLTDWAHAQNALMVAVVNPTSLALLAEPGSWGQKGADIAVGDGQPLGIPLASGGPYFGFICCKQELVRQMPGRIIGRTVDLEGKDGYTLTLQAREQHIRRSKATSNICTNQGLAVTAATIYMSLLGHEGLERVALASHHNAATLKQMLAEVDGVEVLTRSPFFHEFVIRTQHSARLLLEHMAEKGVLAGYELNEHYPELGEAVVVCATEVRTEQDLAFYVEALKASLAELEAAGC